MLTSGTTNKRYTGIPHPEILLWEYTSATSRLSRKPGSREQSQKGSSSITTPSLFRPRKTAEEPLRTDSADAVYTTHFPCSLSPRNWLSAASALTITGTAAVATLGHSRTQKKRCCAAGDPGLPLPLNPRPLVAAVHTLTVRKDAVSQPTPRMLLADIVQSRASATRLPWSHADSYNPTPTARQYAESPALARIHRRASRRPRLTALLLHVHGGVCPLQVGAGGVGGGSAEGGWKSVPHRKHTTAAASPSSFTLPAPIPCLHLRRRRDSRLPISASLSYLVFTPDACIHPPTLVFTPNARAARRRCLRIGGPEDWARSKEREAKYQPHDSGLVKQPERRWSSEAVRSG
ncbi:hypothetical protein DFH06DRAFT_1318135 [Mycena polygramma]|nr:hypothetical protein DFH06DRAFT_1318135 [Mycena polygramma]